MTIKQREAKQAYDQLQYPGDLANDVTKGKKLASTTLPPVDRPMQPRSAWKISKRKFVMGLAAMILLAMWLSPAPAPISKVPHRPTLAKTPGIKRISPRMVKPAMPSLAKVSKRIPSIGKMPRVHWTFRKTHKRQPFTPFKEQSS